MTQVVKVLAFLMLACFALATHSSSFADAANETLLPALSCNESFESTGTNPITAKRLVCADVAAVEQPVVYNRFGSFNPFGMMFALRRDLVPGNQLHGPAGSEANLSANYCDTLDGTETSLVALEPGNVRLKDCKRPRPIVLRANVGDVLKVRLTNMLWDQQPGFSETFCRADKNKTAEPAVAEDADKARLPYHADRLPLRNIVSEALDPEDEENSPVDHQEYACSIESADKDPEQANESTTKTENADWPLTRGISFAVQGLRVVAPKNGTIHPACRGLATIEPGGEKAVDCYFAAEREGTYFLSSKGSPAGGEGEGGSLTHGLFGAVVVQPENTTWYRSQVSRTAFNKVWGKSTLPNSEPHVRQSTINYEALGAGGVPVLNMLAKLDNNSFELVHTDLNAIVHRPGTANCPLEDFTLTCGINFREFSVFFHDELKTFFSKEFEELGRHDQLAGVRDGFAINYGASGMGTMLLANRKGIGPAADCPECLYEEFFLASWANGDPALLEQYSDDPSNVHHSYVNDRVVFRNFHAGPKETHVFHLHAHQWFAGNDPNRGSYLDSQTVGPEQGFTYDIYHGGLPRFSPKDPAEKGKGWFETLGAGNRNRAPGDSIFHCHLYPHFAQGMWELWRNHDVLEDGTRKLPDGQLTPGLSVKVNETPRMSRMGSVNEDGTWRGNSTEADGTPVPALVPMPGQALPLLPSYSKNMAQGMPGYPFYIAGKPGHRPPQAPLDVTESGGLPRHVITGGKRTFEVKGADKLDQFHTIEGTYDNRATYKVQVAADQVENRRRVAQQYVAKVLALGNFAAEFDEINLSFPGDNGSKLEKAAMGFHFNGKAIDGAELYLLKADGSKSTYQLGEGGYDTLSTPVPSAGAAAPMAATGIFHVNGAPPKPGAPFADPCAMASDVKRPRLATTEIAKDLLTPSNASPFNPDPGLTGYRRYNVSAVQLDLITNKAGWHDPQARINVLTERSGEYKTNRRVSANEEPFFFRARSGECIEFRHTNELPKDLELDDFQVKTPTDTIGQHIHLVKFDVTAADGSGNGWNYEDGTFAPDEVVSRICHANPLHSDISQLRNRTLYCENADESATDKTCTASTLCKPKLAYKQFWRQKLDKSKRAEQPFQTTAQRWFADPILSSIGDDQGQANSKGEVVDRTMRTVFTHDHFGPSSIQQHGFYSALIIEPMASEVCSGEDTSEAPSKCSVNASLVEDDAAMIGVHKTIAHDKVALPSWLPKQGEISKENFREYAIAIADFATLYDPQDFESSPVSENGPKGMAMLECEAKYRNAPQSLLNICHGEKKPHGNSTFSAKDMGWSPAWVAASMQGDIDSHRPKDKDGNLASELLNSAETDELRKHLADWRSAAAGCKVPKLDGDVRGIDEKGNLALQDSCSTGMRYAKPVAPPERPESISVDHHDPYLINYRGEPIPLRVGKSEKKTSCLEVKIDKWVGKHPSNALQNALRAPDYGECSVDRQKPDEPGDMANVFRSKEHGDPATPILEAFDGEKTVIRMIQGAQEVQHVFNLDGYTWTRNIDQKFPAGSRRLEHVQGAHRETEYQKCIEAARVGKPLEYQDWFEQKLDNSAKPFWDKYKKAIAECDNQDGRVTAQEIGISEHFEFEGKFRRYAGAEKSAPPTGSATLETKTTDYLYHFGSSDDLWNGAWGLMRVYGTGEEPDLRQCRYTSGALICEDAKIGGRLVEVPKQADVFAKSLESSAKESQWLSENLVQCQTTSLPTVRKAALALTYSQISNTHFSYGGSLTDPDALFLASLEETDVLAQGKWEDLVSGKAKARLLPDLIARVSTSPKPFVMEVKAGDCVELAIINGMKTAKSGKNLRDLLGDALMPPITPLNVDPASNPEQKFEMVNGTRDVKNLEPSARLALRLQLPVLNDPGSFAMPFGYNTAEALRPAKDEIIFARDLDPGPLVNRNNDTANAEMLTFYAGRMRLPVFEDGVEAGKETPRNNLDAAVKYICTTYLKGKSFAAPSGRNFIFATEDASGTPIPCASQKETGVAFFDQRLALDVIDQSQPTSAILVLAEGSESASVSQAVQDAVAAWARDEWQKAAQLALAGDELIHWVPYAFGPIPLKPVGDVIGHATHGLVGVININPTIWADSPRTAGASNIHASAFVHKDDPNRRMRKFTLFMQDGLGLRDKKSLLRPTDENNAHLKDADDEGGLLKSIHPVPDCEVCNDSYDQGEKAVSYMSASYPQMLRQQGKICHDDRDGISKHRQPEANTNFNTCLFPGNFFIAARNAGAPVMSACTGEEISIRVIHPGGRQRQHSFTTIAQEYDDLFPSFGFANGALLGPGKVVTASLSRKAEKGTYVWFDGTSTLRSGGVWGLLEVDDCKP